MVQIANILEKVLLHRDKPPFVRVLIYAAYVIPTIAIAFLTWHEMTNNEMIWSSTEITRPHDAYRSERNTQNAVSNTGTLIAGRNYWSPTDDYRAAFLAEFSKAYFERPSRFDMFLPDIERSGLTIILENSASARSMFVNSISVVAILEDDRPFDWRRLDVATDLTIQPAEWNGTLTFINSGTGPILNLAATLTGDDKRPFEPFKPEGLLTHKWLVSLTPKGGTYIGPFPDISDAHVETLYRTIDPKESTTSRGPFVDCRPIEPVDHRCNGVVRALYEEVTSVTRLMELTDLKRVSSIDIDYRLSI